MIPLQSKTAGHVPLRDAKQNVALQRVLAEAKTSPGAVRRSLPLGLPEVDRHLPQAGLAYGALHEVAACSHGDRPAAFGFSVALAALALHARPAPVLLITSLRSFADFGTPYAHGLCQLGLDAARLVIIETGKDKDALWAMEEASRSKAVAVVMGAVEGDLNLTQSRRLSLAAASSGTPLLLMRAPRATGTTASVTRWCIAAAPAARDRFGTLAHPRWSVNLERCRNGRPGQWLLEWDHAAYRFRLAQGLADCPSLASTKQRLLRLAG
jgi:protein ImuA